MKDDFCSTNGCSVERATSCFWFIPLYCVIVLAGTRLFSFQGFPKNTIGLLDAVAMAVIFGWALISEFKKTVHFGKERKFVVTIILLPFASVFTAYFYHDQDLYQTVWAFKGIFYWSLYFVLRDVRIKPKILLQVLVWLGLAWALINIIQQFTYPSIFFLGKESENPDLFVNYRAGIYRFLMYGAEIAVFSGLYCFSKLFIKFKIVDILIMVVSTLGVYYCGTRQILMAYLVSAFFVFCVGFVRYWQRNFVYALVIVALLVSFFVFYSGEVFGELTSVTLNEANTSNVRWRAMNFFIFDNWSGFWTILFGNGPFFLSEKAASDYGLAMNSIRNTYGFFHSDVGVFGALNLYGILYACVVTGFLVRLIVRSFQRMIYSAAFFIYTLWVLPLNFLFISSSAIPLYCTLIYCIEEQENEGVEE